MALTLKIKYFNTFVLRQKPIVTTSVVASHTVASSAPASNEEVTLTATNASIAINQEVHVH